MRNSLLLQIPRQITTWCLQFCYLFHHLSTRLTFRWNSMQTTDSVKEHFTGKNWINKEPDILFHDQEWLKKIREGRSNQIYQITLVDRKILVSEWICINNSVITLVDKRPKNRLQLILIVHKKYPESWNMRYLVTVKLNDGTFIHLISEFSRAICS